MYRILLCCAAGMSTSLLVTKMEKAAAAKGIEAKIWAVPESEAVNQLPVDIVMIGPQIRFAHKKVQEAVGDIPVVDIEMRMYGRMDGEGVLNQALKIIEGK